MWKDLWGAEMPERAPSKSSHNLIKELSHSYKCFCSQASWRPRRDQDKLYRGDPAPTSLLQCCSPRELFPRKYDALISLANICPEIPCYTDVNTVSALTHCWTSHRAGGKCKEEKQGMCHCLQLFWCRFMTLLKRCSKIWFTYILVGSIEVSLKHNHPTQERCGLHLAHDPVLLVTAQISTNNHETRKVLGNP